MPAPKNRLVSSSLLKLRYSKTVPFTFITKTPPAAVLLKKAAGIDKASGEPNKNKVATIKRDKVKEIAETKMKDLNAADV